MEFCSGTIVDLGLIETAFEILGVVSATSVSPTENLGRRFAVHVHPDETVPKTRRRDVRLVRDLVRILRKHIPDNRQNLEQGLSCVDLRTAIARRGQSALVLYQRARQHFRARVIERRADAGRADVDSENVFLRQDEEGILAVSSWLIAIG